VVALPESARLLLAPAPPEAILEVWHAAHRLGGRLVHREVDGYLVLTTERAAFIQVVGSGRRRTFHMVPDCVFPLDAIRELREDPLGILRVSDAEFRIRGAGGAAAFHRIAGAREERVRELSRPPPPTFAPPTVVRERVIVREVVQVPCRYCGTLRDQLATRCPACGARSTA
jgi:hypothetical protein